MRDDCQTPSPAEIAAACMLIQAGWLPQERLRRMSSDMRPTVRLADGRLQAIDADDYDEHHEQNAQFRRVRDDAHQAAEI